ncbi:MAG: phosphohistidine phosphatase SixA [Mariprofundaceae bacterium]|nr:phosphohistidine phosphatase SixA [Mariprofundaceae bacterium]
MHLYLVQHGEALSREEDAQRPLSKQGADAVRRMGDYLYSKAGLVVPEVLHSGKARAEQTAELLARCLNGVFSAGPDLNPNDDPGLWSAHLAARSEDVMLVGHLPHLQRLAALLLSGSANQAPVSFTHAGVVCLERDSEGGWHLQWAMTPALLG